MTSPGREQSIYSYLHDQVSGYGDPELILSYLYGRVICKDTPPMMTTSFLIKELDEGKHGDVIPEVAKAVAD